MTVEGRKDWKGVKVAGRLSISQEISAVVRHRATGKYSHVRQREEDKLKKYSAPKDGECLAVG